MLTCLATAMVALLGPWNRPASVSKSPASYKPFPVQVQSPSVVTPAPSTGFHDSTFDIAAAPLPMGFPAGTELHVIGVYEGALPNGQTEQPWWAKCTNTVDNKPSMIECHSKYAGQHTEKTITVTVSKSSAPMVLALMAYEPVKWKIIGATGKNILKIILAGNHGQDIDGDIGAMPVEVHSYHSSPCQICSRQGDHFYAYKQESPEYTQAITKLYALTGISPTSFQGAYRAERFYVSNSTVRLPLDSKFNSSNTTLDFISDKDFVDRLLIAGMNVPLPEGRWHGIAFSQSPTNRGIDQLVVLARIEKNQFSELIAVRAQIATDGKGFPQQLSCNAKGLHANKVETNEAFGTQLCYFVNHSTDPWSQPIYGLAANRLAKDGIALPQLLINAGFHKADKTSALTVHYLANPDAKGIITPQTNWYASPWHPDHINHFHEMNAYVQDRIRWSAFWFQIFKATRP